MDPLLGTLNVPSQIVQSYGGLFGFCRGHKVIVFACWATDHVTQRIQFNEIVALAA
jgi:hypothetical protein